MPALRTPATPRIADKKAQRGQWSSYIGQYTTGDKNSSHRVLEALTEEFGVARLAPPSADELEVRERAREFLRDRTQRKKLNGQSLSRALDKADRDSDLYAAIVRYHKSRRAQEGGSMCVLVSSARRLADVEKHIGETGERRVVMPLGVVLHLLSLAPEVHVGLPAMGAYLLDEKIRRFSSDLEQMLLRVVRGCNLVDLPWARRSELIRKVRGRAIEVAEGRDAAPRGVAPRDRASAIFKERESEAVMVEAMREALDALALDTKAEKENARLRRTVEILEDEVARLKKSN